MHRVACLPASLLPVHWLRRGRRRASAAGAGAAAAALARPRLVPCRRRQPALEQSAAWRARSAAARRPRPCSPSRTSSCAAPVCCARPGGATSGSSVSIFGPAGCRPLRSSALAASMSGAPATSVGTQSASIFETGTSAARARRSSKRKVPYIAADTTEMATMKPMVSLPIALERDVGRLVVQRPGAVVTVRAVVVGISGHRPTPPGDTDRRPAGAPGPSGGSRMRRPRGPAPRTRRRRPSSARRTRPA